MFVRIFHLSSLNNNYTKHFYYKVVLTSIRFVFNVEMFKYFGSHDMEERRGTVKVEKLQLVVPKNNNTKSIIHTKLCII